MLAHYSINSIPRAIKLCRAPVRRAADAGCHAAQLTLSGQMLKGPTTVHARQGSQTGIAAMTTENKLIEIFVEFTQLRQGGRSRDDAWKDIEPLVSTLTQKELNRLLSLLRGWEAKEGRHFKPIRQDDPYETHYHPPEGVAELREQHRAAQQEAMNDSAADQPARRRGGVIRRIQPRDDQPPADPNVALCPRCREPNRAGELYCAHCGALLVGDGGGGPGDTRPMHTTRPDASYFGDEMTLYLHVRGMKNPLRVQPGVAELVVGRQSPDSVMVPDIDLSAFDAESMGVSRLHASLKRHGDTLVLADMGSLNHTYVNNQRLHAHELRVLHDGDEIRFGKLQVRVLFRQE